MAVRTAWNTSTAAERFLLPSSGAPLMPRLGGASPDCPPPSSCPAFSLPTALITTWHMSHLCLFIDRLLTSLGGEPEEAGILVCLAYSSLASVMESALGK